MRNRSEQPAPMPDANPDWGSTEGKNAYEENLRKQRQNIRNEDEKKVVRKLPDDKPHKEVTDFIERLKKKSEQKPKSKPEQLGLPN